MVASSLDNARLYNLVHVSKAIRVIRVIKVIRDMRVVNLWSSMFIWSNASVTMSPGIGYSFIASIHIYIYIYSKVKRVIRVISVTYERGGAWRRDRWRHKLETSQSGSPAPRAAELPSGSQKGLCSLLYIVYQGYQCHHILSKSSELWRRNK